MLAEPARLNGFLRIRVAASVQHPAPWAERRQAPAVAWMLLN